ncbi:MAG: glycoside hydrolase family 172 protein [Armatimonadota bacterium]
MKLNFIFATLLCLPAVSGSAQAQQPFDELWDLRSLALKSDFKAYEATSYDRTGGNKDWGSFVSVERNRKVLADISGPGEISRIWSANPSGTLQIFLNGETTPSISGEFSGVFHDAVSPFRSPLATTSSGGSISYWPIRFEKSARVEVLNGADFYYQVSYRTFDRTESESVLAPVSSSDASYRNAVKAWKAPGSPLSQPSRDVLVEDGTAQTLKKILRIKRGGSAVVHLKGSGYVSEFRLMLPSGQITHLRRTRLVIRWDGATAAGVDVPLLDLFGSSFTLKDYRSLLTGRSSDGWWYLRFPMPFKKSASISLVNQSGAPLTVPVQIRWVKGKLSSDSLYYRASFHTAITQNGRPHKILRASGEGQFVGLTISMQGISGLGFLEGDEMVSVDGRSSTEYNGTGTEDYFNSGWYFREGPVAQPLHGCLVKDDESSRISVYRFHLTDRIPFKESIDFDLEHGGVNDAPGAVYSSIAHWYSSRPADASTAPVNAVRLSIPRKPYVSPANALALAALARTERSGGTVKKANWESISDTFSGGPLLIFRPANIGNAVSLQLNIPYADNGPIAMVVCKGPGMGKVRVSMDEVVIGEVDLWSPEANHPAIVDLQGVLLQSGVHSLRIQSIGRNSASKGLAIALSHLQLGSSGAFIQKWAVLGPIRAGESPLIREHIPNENAPAWSGEYEGGFGTVRWVPKDANNDVLELPKKDNSVNYAAAIIDASQPFKTEMLLGSDDSVKVWLNGQLVHSKSISRGAIPDSDVVPVHLKVGQNLLVAKVSNGSGGSGLVVRFRDLNKALAFTTPKLPNQ